MGHAGVVAPPVALAVCGLGDARPHPGHRSRAAECADVTEIHPGGRYQPSKAYTWTCTLLGRAVQAGESVSLDAALPMACRLKIRRVNGQGQPIEFANIVDLEAWPDGGTLLTQDLRQKLATWLRMKQDTPPSPAPTPAPVPPPPPAPAPQGWPHAAPTPAPAAAPAAPAGARPTLAW